MKGALEIVDDWLNWHADPAKIQLRYDLANMIERYGDERVREALALARMGAKSEAKGSVPAEKGDDQ